ncbi:MAG: glycosyltransferase family 2 protein [Gemmatimonadetes bacterium]|nr:glycosyltransferase family 2 protein [Gemmatimonadota bacterium]NNK64747.1 glycosyltransferase family 2 protein [Gemmatimonadota bacterium]
MASVPSKGGTPEVSFVIPCYNEEALIGYTIPRLMKAFQAAGHDLEIIAVDNGSTDRTADILSAMSAENPRILVQTVEVNRGYGAGILSGLPRAAAPWVGIIPADGQVDEDDVVRLYEAVVLTDGHVLGKVRRRFRMDGFRRKVVSVGYNLLFRIMWPKLRSLDINGSPKLLPRPALDTMALRSEGWLLDPEIMIKAHHMDMDVLELNVFSRMRGNGVSNVRPTTVFEFLSYLMRFRFSKRWKREFRAVAQAGRQLGAAHSTPANGG